MLERGKPLENIRLAVGVWLLGQHGVMLLTYSLEQVQRSKHKSLILVFVLKINKPRNKSEM